MKKGKTPISEQKEYVRKIKEFDEKNFLFKEDVSGNILIISVVVIGIIAIIKICIDCMVQLSNCH